MFVKKNVKAIIENALLSPITNKTSLEENK